MAEKLRICFWRAATMLKKGQMWDIVDGADITIYYDYNVTAWEYVQMCLPHSQVKMDDVCE